MDDAGPRAELFVAQVVKAVSGRDEYAEDGEQGDAIGPVAMRIPGELHMRRQQCSKEDEHGHGKSAVQFHHPGLAGTGNKIVALRDDVVQPNPDCASSESDRERTVKCDFVAATKPDGIGMHAR